MKKVFMHVIVACLMAVIGFGSAHASLERAGWRPSGERAGNVATSRPAELKPAALFGSRPASFADLAERVQSSVVNISTTKKMRRPQTSPFPRFGPRDPFDNKTLRYFILDNSYTIYSIGDDLVDNNGLSRQQLKDQTGKSPKQYDWPFTVKW